MKLDPFERLNKMKSPADRYCKPVKAGVGVQPRDLWYFPFNLTRKLNSSSLEETGAFDSTGNVCDYFVFVGALDMMA